MQLAQKCMDRFILFWTMHDKSVFDSNAVCFVRWLLMDRLYIRLGSIHWMAIVFSLILMSALNRRKNADEEGRRKSELYYSASVWMHHSCIKTVNQTRWTRSHETPTLIYWLRNRATWYYHTCYNADIILFQSNYLSWLLCHIFWKAQSNKDQ